MHIVPIFHSGSFLTYYLSLDPYGRNDLKAQKQHKIKMFLPATCMYVLKLTPLLHPLFFPGQPQQPKGRRIFLLVTSSSVRLNVSSGIARNIFAESTISCF